MTIEVPEDNFRFQAKKFLLTYKGHLDKETLFLFINQKMKCECSVKICHEVGESGYKHTHCAVLSPRKPNITNCRHFDFEGVHPNVRLPKPPNPAQHWKNIVKYVDKQDEEVFGEIPIEQTSDEKFEEAIAYVKSCTTWNKVLDAPTPILKTISAKFGFFQNFHQFKGKGMDQRGYFHLSEFNLPALDLTKAVVLIGPRDVGKTQFALAHFNNPLQVKEKDDILRFQEDIHDGIVFDDTQGLLQLEDKEVINWTEMVTSTTIKCRYRSVLLPAGLRRIFTSNNYPFPKSTNVDIARAIEKRLNVVTLRAPTYNIKEARTKRSEDAQEEVLGSDSLSEEGSVRSSEDDEEEEVPMEEEMD